MRAVNSPWEPIHAADVAFLRVISLKSMENNPALQQIWEHTIPVLQGAPAARADAEIQQSARGCVCASHTALCLCDDGGEMSVCICWGSLVQGDILEGPHQQHREERRVMLIPGEHPKLSPAHSAHPHKEKMLPAVM